MFFYMALAGHHAGSGIRPSAVRAFGEVEADRVADLYVGSSAFDRVM
jgi:hypothetical protein